MLHTLMGIETPYETFILHCTLLSTLNTIKHYQKKQMKVILNQQITDLQPEDNIEEIEVEDYHLYQSDDPNDVNPQEPWAW